LEWSLTGGACDDATDELGELEAFAGMLVNGFGYGPFNDPDTMDALRDSPTYALYEESGTMGWLSYAGDVYGVALGLAFETDADNAAVLDSEGAMVPLEGVGPSSTDAEIDGYYVVGPLMVFTI
jgi:hypothetical protein